MSPLEVFLSVALVLFLYVSLWTLLAIIKKRADLADTAWGLGFFVAAWSSMLFSGFSLYGLIVNLLVTIWAVRICSHIYLRNRGREEDFRYQNLKKKWGSRISLRIFTDVFLLQGVLLYTLALPILWIQTHSAKAFWPILWIAIPLWIFGFIVEALGDRELSLFQKKASNKGKLLKTGLWSWVRHPNYFGEIIQWWAIWLLAAKLPLGWAFIISPLLLSFLILKVSGVKPLEEKMKKHPDFESYAKKTPSVFPTTFLNALFYAVGWLVFIFCGPRIPSWFSLATFIACFSAQVALFKKRDQETFVALFPLAFCALFLGFFQEMLFIHFSLISYVPQMILPPLWLLLLYPLFSQTLNSSLKFLNQNLYLSFVLGGVGSLSSYFSGQALGDAHILSSLFYPVAFFSWGIYLTLLLLLNRALNRLSPKYVDPSSIRSKLTVFFDATCPICSREMETLKKRKQTGLIEYATMTSSEDFEKFNAPFSYEEAMNEIHAIDSKGEILQGTDALAALYARVDLSWISVLLEAPGFRPIFKVVYFIWAKFRNRRNRCLKIQ